MRVAETPYEERDCLAHDWGVFFAQYLPDWDWVPIPNMGADAGNLWQRWQLAAAVLSGGNDIGTVPQRDETERSLLEAAATLQLPGTTGRKVRMTPNQHGPLIPWATHVIQWTVQRVAIP